jgi:predicted phage tail protein
MERPGMTAPALVTVRLHGPLSEKFGHEHHFAVRTPMEAVNALDANHPGFRREFLKHERYGIYADEKWIDEDTIPLLAVQREIDLCPVVEGRIVAALASGIASLFAISSVAATIIASVIVFGVFLGASMLLAPKVKKPTNANGKDEDSASKSEESYIFSGPENVTEQGVAVPLVYGYTHCGSVVISASLETSDIPVSATAGFNVVGYPGGIQLNSVAMSRALPEDGTPSGPPPPLELLPEPYSTDAPPTITQRRPHVPRTIYRTPNG